MNRKLIYIISMICININNVYADHLNDLLHEAEANRQDRIDKDRYRDLDRRIRDRDTERYNKYGF